MRAMRAVRPRGDRRSAARRGAVFGRNRMPAVVCSIAAVLGLPGQRVMAQADLGVTKTVSNDRPVEGEEIVYTVTVTNGGPMGATGVTVDDLLPAGVTFVGVDSIDQGVYDEVLGVWDVGALPNATSVELAVRVSANAGTAETTGTGEFIDVFTSGGGFAEGLTFGPDGNLYVSSYLTDQVLVHDGMTGAFIDVFASGGGLDAPRNLTFGPDGSLYVSSTGTDQILRYDGTTGGFLDIFATGGGLDLPTGVTFGSGESLFVSSFSTSQILRYDGTTGAFIEEFASGGGLFAPEDLTFGLDGDLFVSSRFTSQVLRYDGATGAFIEVFATGGGLSQPRGLTFGPDGNLYVSSIGTDQILRYDGMTGAFIDVFASGGGLADPAGVIFGPDGNLYVGADEVFRYRGFITNFATVLAAEPDPDALNNQASAGITVLAPIAADLGVTKTVSNDRPIEGEEIVYTITVTNDGPEAATAVTVDDLLPAGVTFVGVDSIDQGAYDEALGVWDVGALPDATSVALAVRASVDAGTAETTGTGEFIDVFASGGGLNGPVALTFGPDGNLYVSSRDTHQVLRYDGTTGAFLGVFASGGGLVTPTGLTFGPDGNLYVATLVTAQVLRYDGMTGAFIDVFASGGGLQSALGLTFGPDANLYVSSDFTDQIVRYDGMTGAFMNVFASGGGLDSPRGLRFGLDGNLYVSSSTDQVLRYDGTTGAFMDVFASGGGLNDPRDLTFGPDRNLYVSSYLTDQILRYDGTTGFFMGVFASGGGASEPEGLTFGPGGSLYVSSYGTDAVLRYRGFITNTATVSAIEPDPDILDNADFAGITVVEADLAVTKTVSNATPIEGEEIVYTITVTNDGPTGATGVTVNDLLPAGVTFVGVDSIDQGAYEEGTGGWDVGDLADGTTVQLAVRASVDEGTEETTGTGEFIDVFASGGGLSNPTGLTFGPDCDLYVADLSLGNVLRYDGATGAFIGVFANDAGLGLTFGPDGNLYVASVDVRRYDGATGEFIDVFASGGGLSSPTGLTFGPDGNLYVTSAGTVEVLRYDGTTGAFIDVFASGGGLDFPLSLAFGPDGNLYVTSGGASEVLRYDGATGAFIDVFASGGGLVTPWGLRFGPDGNLYVSSTGGTYQVLRYDGTTGVFIDAFASEPALLDPLGLTFGPDGNLYVGSLANSSVLRFRGFITNVATVSAAEPDPNALDNVDFAGIVVGGPFAFEAPYDAPTQGEPLVHVVGNLDTALSSDGTIDVAVVIPDPDPSVGGAVQIFLNLGNDVDGTWLGLEPQLPVIPVGADPSDIAAGDFNGDDYLDLAVTNAFDGSVSILLNAADGSGTFVAGPVIPGFDTPSAVAAADFLGLGATDIAVAESGIANVEYLENDGGAAFTPVVGVIVGAAPIALDPQDIDDPKNIDAVSANFGGDSLTVMLNGGGGSFSTLPDIAVGLGPVDLATGDLNFDGLADLVSANNGDGTVSIVRNLGPPGDGGGDGAGDGPPVSFAPAMNLAAGAMLQSVEIVDLDGDLDVDLVVVATDAQVGPALLLFENLFVGGGGLTFAPPVAMSIGADPQSVLSGDFNEDGAIDLVTVNVDGSAPLGGSVTVILNTVFPCPGDLDASGDVGFGDILTLLGLWGPCQIGLTCEGDLDINGGVGFSDLLMLLGGWGECP